MAFKVDGIDQLAKGISMADGIKELKQYISRLEQSLEWSEEENSIMKKAATAMLLTNQNWNHNCKRLMPS